MEEYKLLKSVKRPTNLELRYLLSNKGNIKIQAYFIGYFVDEDILEIGKGIYIRDGEICVYHMGKGKIYKNIYKLFKGDIPKGYHIHHLDYNHFNNNIDNLLCCDNYDHGCLHSYTSRFMYGYKPQTEKEKEEYNKWLTANKIKEEYSKLNYTSEDSRKYIFKILLKKYEQKAKEIKKYLQNKRKEDINKKREENKQKYEQERQNKIKSGEYYLNDKGHLIKRNKIKWTEEQREQIINKRKYIYNTKEWKDNYKKACDEEWKKRVSEGVKRYWKEKRNKDKNMIL